MFSMNTDLCKVTLSLAISALMVSGCSAGDTGEEAAGRIEMKLVGQAPSGNVYRLSDAIVRVEGLDASIVFDTRTDPNQSSLTATVPAGSYTSLVEPGWQMERLQPDGSAQTVEAELLSPNPNEFTVIEDQNTQVALRFRAGDDVVVIDEGSFDIILDVEEALSPLSACPFPEVGAGRECDWALAPGFEGASCTPGEELVVGCGCAGGACEGDPMIRVCEGQGACSAASAIALVDDACGLCPQTFFTCPESGMYSVLVAAYGSSSPFVCEPVTNP
jgi:hypothetical protein